MKLKNQCCENRKVRGLVAEQAQVRDLPSSEVCGSG